MKWCLEFTITKFTKAKDDEQEWLRFHVQEVFGQIVNWNVLSFQRQDDANLKPNPREPAFKIGCKTLFNARKNLQLFEIYLAQTSAWVQRMEVCSSEIQKLPWLSLDKNDAYPKVHEASHEDIPVAVFALGTLARPTEFFQSFSVCSSKGFPITANFYHDTKQMQITLGGTYQFQIQYQNIRHIIVSEKAFWLDIYFYITCPPRLCTIIFQKEGSKTAAGQRSGKGTTSWHRSLVIPMKHYTTDKLGRSNTLHVRLTKIPQSREIISRLFFRCGKKSIVFVPIKETDVSSMQFGVNVDLGSFNCSYMFNGLLWRNFVIQLQNLPFHFPSTLNQMIKFCNMNSKLLYLSLVDIMHLLDEGIFFDFNTTISRIFQWYCQNDNSVTHRKEYYIQPSKTQKIFRITMTPSRWILWPAEVMKQNRILRTFNPEYACRISFRDEDLTRLSLQAASSDYNFYEHVIRMPMMGGVNVGPRHYQFLGWSNSQVREHGVWLYSRDEANQTVLSIRNWMGDFSHIRSVPKFMARMGQCFSQTEETVKVPLESAYVHTEDDIMHGMNPVSKKPYCFSDGVGSLSLKLRKQVCNKLGLKDCPSAFQIRYAGFKGMLVVNPDLKDVDILFRKSMEKFPCTGSHCLEICKSSKFVPVFLNRQLITILDHMGVPSSVFLKFQEDMLGTLTDMLLYNKNAAEYLDSNCPLVDLNFKGLAAANIGLNVEPFFRSMLLALHKKAVEGIRAKARLAIDPAFGRNMFGVLDETATLKYGQVFIQYTTREGQPDTSIHIGRVLVTKNPCLQPGDVRVLQAVDVPALHHIFNCIVFPQDGHRPHADEMAGSDLDGDEFTAIWDDSLFFDGPNAEPSHFPIPREELKEAPIGVEDMIEFLCRYIQNDQVGIIGNAHLTRADELGLEHPLCTGIAQKFSLAVDFVKNGQLVTLDKNEKPKVYPDFMNKGCQAKMYRSTKTLGKLFRVCKDFEMENENFSISYDNVELDPELVYPGWENYKDSAAQTLYCYNRLIEGVLQQYGLTHEAEATARAFLNIHGRLKERSDRVEAEELVVLSIQTLWKNMKKDFFKEFMVKSEKAIEKVGGAVEEVDLWHLDPVTEKSLQKASAWYVVTYTQNRPTFLSFPWIMSTLLVLVKTKNQKLKGIASQLSECFVERLQKMLTNCLDLENLLTLDMCLLTLVNWAQHHQLIPDYVEPTTLKDSPWVSRQESKLIPLNILIKIFMEVNQNHMETSSPMELFLRFLRKCITLRFISKEKIEQYSCNIKTTTTLGKAAMCTYHSLAVSGSLSALGIRPGGVEEVESEREMNPIRVESNLLEEHKLGNYKSLKEQLQLLSGVGQVSVRNKNSFVLISATGTSKSLKMLTLILSKDPCQWILPVTKPKSESNPRKYVRNVFYGSAPL